MVFVIKNKINLTDTLLTMHNTKLRTILEKYIFFGESYINGLLMNSYRNSCKIDFFFFFFKKYIGNEHYKILNIVTRKI